MDSKRVAVVVAPPGLGDGEWNDRIKAVSKRRWLHPPIVRRGALRQPVENPRAVLVERVVDPAAPAEDATLLGHLVEKPMADVDLERVSERGVRTVFGWSVLPLWTVGVALVLAAIALGQTNDGVPSALLWVAAALVAMDSGRLLMRKDLGWLRSSVLFICLPAILLIVEWFRTPGRTVNQLQFVAVGTVLLLIGNSFLRWIATENVSG